MGVWSDGSYDVAPGLIYSFPVTVKVRYRLTALSYLINHCVMDSTLRALSFAYGFRQDGVISIVQGLSINEFSRQKMTATQEELVCAVFFWARQITCTHFDHFFFNNTDLLTAVLAAVRARAGFHHHQVVIAVSALIRSSHANIIQLKKW